MINAIKEVGAICEKLMYVAMARIVMPYDLKANLDLVEKLDTIDPTWLLTAPTSAKDTLELLLEIHSLGVKPGELHKLIK